MITIKSDLNAKMLENFQNQTFPDISIVTATSKINLVLAYLCIDSGYFASLEPDILEVDLSGLPEQALLQILRSLYGDKLMVYSVQELEEVYRVIRELEIEDYKASIEKEIVKNHELMENLEVLQFCFHNELLIEQLKAFHLKNNLRSLEESRNFLQLNKITLDTLIPILIEYIALNGDQAYSIINNIMENYFNRNNIRAADFFTDHNVQVLQAVWEKFHHTLQLYDRKPISSSSPYSDKIYSSNGTSIAKRCSITLTVKKEEQAKQMQSKDKRIAFLEDQIRHKEITIQSLRKELHEIRRAKGSSTSSRRTNSMLMLPSEDEDISIVEGVKSSSKKTQKARRNMGKNSASETGLNNDILNLKRGLVHKVAKP